ncbi:hypothetical protein AA313_de0207079 [Arthrobotrys entomopaga]|nr:hypothetical protein AA313_de0207079 [Arthrobotrys entomopaga]
MVRVWSSIRDGANIDDRHRLRSLPALHQIHIVNIFLLLLLFLMNLLYPDTARFLLFKRIVCHSSLSLQLLADLRNITIQPFKSLIHTFKHSLLQSLTPWTILYQIRILKVLFFFFFPILV